MVKDVFNADSGQLLSGTDAANYINSYFCEIREKLVKDLPHCSEDRVSIIGLYVGI